MDFPPESNTELQIITRLFLLGKTMEKLSDPNSNEGLFNSESNILFALDLSPDQQMFPGQLMQITMLTSGAMTAALNRLIKRGLIERSIDEFDKRKAQIRLTEEGKEQSIEILRSRRLIAGQFLNELDEIEKVRLIKMLRKL